MKSTLNLVLVVCLLLPSCGYRFSGGGSLPGGAETISVLMLENRTAETGIQTRLTSDITFEITRRDSSRVARPENADALLAGIVKTVQVSQFGKHGDRYNQRNTPGSLQGRDYRGEAPIRY